MSGRLRPVSVPSARIFKFIKMINTIEREFMCRSKRDGWEPF